MLGCCWDVWRFGSLFQLRERPTKVYEQVAGPLAKAAMQKAANLGEDVPPLPELDKSGENDAKKMQESFMLSQSGTFKVEDFNLNKKGLLAATERDSPQGSGSSTLRGSAPGLEVHSMDELDIQNELGKKRTRCKRRRRAAPLL